MTRITIAGMRGSPLPNLEAHGLGRKMKEAKNLIDEQARLRQRVSELGAEQQQLKEEIKRRKHEHTQAWGRAMRAGEEPPSEEDIRRSEKRLEAVTSETAPYVTPETSQTVSCGRPWPNTAKSGAPRFRPKARRYSPRRKR
jgi:hypothetical protein